MHYSHPSGQMRILVHNNKLSVLQNFKLYEVIVANSLANRPLCMQGLFDADPRYEPLPSVFPGPKPATGAGRGGAPPHGPH